MRLNLAAPVAVVGACSAVGVGSAQIKWPNDVWAGGQLPRKLSGVILDYNGGDSAVLGVGLNVLQDMELHPTATSIATLLGVDNGPALLSPGPHCLRERLLSSFCVELERLVTTTTLLLPYYYDCTTTTILLLYCYY